LQLKQVNQAISQIAAQQKTPLVQVATDCGFYDQAHFIRIFTRYTGIAPLAYKKIAQAGNVHSVFPNSINPQKGNFVQFFG
jgi:AraC-like DNA-binding protein